ncbi:DNA cytosine methyltransferase [Nocardia sp. NPDC049707]|uniref:DNA cytosine methyltransferase n=1 Tax=Nocardia sp. NPDC049707 TaxID=3154735 RepID=UPI0034260723
MRIGSLFSGAGALDLAALELFPGSSMAWHCEVDPAASKVLAHHWPDVPNLKDVTAVDWSQVEPVDVLTGGFPCQDVSTAGLRAGLTDGTRSGLWSVMRDAVAVLRPRWVLIENVKGLLSAAAIRGVESADDDLGDRAGRPVLRALGAVLGDLADVGYDAAWACVRASDVGASHQRARVFILAFPADADRAGLQRPGERTGSDAARAATHKGRRHSAGRDREHVALLPTPQVADVTGGHKTRSGARSNELLLPGLAEAYTAGALLPTPRASDGTKGGPNQRGSSGDLMLLSAVAQLLSTPLARDYKGVPGADFNSANLCRDVRDMGSRWGAFGAAIRRQELLSRPVPPPTEPNSRGNQRLSPAFAEWMMFWPAGWVTDPAIGLFRSDQLKIIGNGVVPRQAVAAFDYLMSVQAVAA